MHKRENSSASLLNAAGHSTNPARYKQFISVEKMVLQKGKEEAGANSGTGNNKSKVVYGVELRVDDLQTKEKWITHTKFARLNPEIGALEWKEEKRILFNNSLNITALHNKEFRAILWSKPQDATEANSILKEIKLVCNEMPLNQLFEIKVNVNAELKLYIEVALQSQSFMYKGILIDEQKGRLGGKKTVARQYVLDSNMVLFYFDKPRRKSKLGIFDKIKSSGEPNGHVGLPGLSQDDIPTLDSVKGFMLIDHDTRIEIINDEELAEKMMNQQAKNVVSPKPTSDKSSKDSSISEDAIEAQKNALVDVVKQKMEEDLLQGDFDMEELQDCYVAAAQKMTDLCTGKSDSGNKGRPKRSYSMGNMEKQEGEAAARTTEKFKFQIIPEFSVRSNKAAPGRRYVLVAENERSRKEWTNFLSQCVIEQRRKLDDLSDYESDLFGSIGKYNPFIKYIAQELDTVDVVNILNSIELKYAEKLTCPLILFFDSSSEYSSSIELCKAAITAEINQSLSPETIFRRNSLSSKLLTLFFKLVGSQYLKDVLESSITAICKENRVYEIDPNRIKFHAFDENNPKAAPKIVQNEQEAQQAAATNGKRLTNLCKSLLKVILDSVDRCPVPIREVLAHTYKVAATKFPQQSPEVSVGGILFLRFICPAIITPHLFGLSEEPLSNAARTLTLLTKVFQNIANQVTTENKKEMFMKELRPFTIEHIEPTKEFLKTVATVPQPKEGTTTTTTPDTAEGTKFKVQISRNTQLKALHNIHKYLAFVQDKELFKFTEKSHIGKFRLMLEKVNIIVTSKVLLSTE